MFSRRNVETNGVLIMNYNSVGSPVDPSLIGITGDIDASRPNVATAIMFMPLRGRKLKEIDVLFFIDILKKGAFLDHLRRYRFDLLIFLSPGTDEIHLCFARRKIQGKSQSLS